MDRRAIPCVRALQSLVRVASVFAADGTVANCEVTMTLSPCSADNRCRAPTR